MNAYVTFIIKNDSYLPGALLFAYALKKQKTKNELLCFVSRDISMEAVKTLQILYDDVIFVDSIVTKNKRQGKRNDLNELFTRFSALRLDDSSLNYFTYEKIIIADCDILPISNWDSLFLLDAPAGILNEKKENCMEWDEAGKFIIPDSYYKTLKWKWHEIYKDYPHGHLIKKEITDRINNDVNNMGINAGLYLLETSSLLYNEILEDLEKDEIRERIDNYIWPEMQYLTVKLSGKWHNIDLKYASFNGYPEINNLYGIHYVGLNPWDFKNKSIYSYAKFYDFKLWYLVFLKMIEDYPKLTKNHDIKDLYKNIKKLDIKKEELDVENIKHLID